MADQVQGRSKKSVGAAEVWVADRFDACWEDLELVRNLQGRRISALYVDWNEISFDTNTVMVWGEQLPPPAVAYIRSRVMTQTRPGTLGETYDQLEMLSDAGTRLINPVGAVR